MIIALVLALINETYCLIVEKVSSPVEINVYATSIVGIVLPLASAFLLKIYQIILLKAVCQNLEDEKISTNRDITYIAKEKSQEKTLIPIIDLKPANEDYNFNVGRA